MEAELVGALITFPESVQDVHNALDASFFSDPVCSAGFQAIQDIQEAQAPICMGTISSLIDNPDTLDVLAEAASCSGTSAYVKHHSQVVLETGLRSRLASTLNNLGHRLECGSADTMIGFQSAMDEIHKFESLLAGVADLPGLDLTEALDQVLRDAEDLQNGVTQNIVTDLQCLDRHTAGLSSGELWVLAAATSAGKSALATQIAVTAAKSGHRVAFFSLEMPAVQLARRLAAAEASLEPWRVTSGALHPGDWVKLTDACGGISHNHGSNLRFFDKVDQRIDSISQVIRQLKKSWDVDLVILDYLQLIGGPRHENRHQEVAAVSRTLKGLAITLNIPILAVSQFNRQAGENPRLENLAESGAIEKDADVVLFIQCQDRVPNALDIAKNRHGERRRIPIKFLPNSLTFEEV